MEQIAVGAVVTLKRDVARTPLTVTRVVDHAPLGVLLTLSRGPGDLGGCWWLDEVEQVTP